ncbi:MAG: hypothetical protein KIS85_07450 [Anaerolineales bacterium]|nr:hypothetical protein [Anaerolineales bacterium]
MEPKALTKDELNKLRQGLKPVGKFETVDQAAELLDKVGIMGTWSTIGSLASLSTSVIASPTAEQLVWGVQAALPQAKRAHYAKVLENRGTLISMNVLPLFIAIAGGVSYEERYQAGQLTTDAHAIAAYLDKHGATAVDDLRKFAGYSSKEKGNLFKKALEELQQQLLISPCGQKPGNGNFMITIWDLTKKWYSSAELQGPDAEHAAQQLIQILVNNGKYVLDSELSKWFSPYNTDPKPIIDQLITENKLIIYGAVGRARILTTGP